MKPTRSPWLLGVFLAVAAATAAAQDVPAAGEEQEGDRLRNQPTGTATTAGR